VKNLRRPSYRFVSRLEFFCALCDKANLSNPWRALVAATPLRGPSIENLAKRIRARPIVGVAMSDSLVKLEPFAVRPRDGARLAGCGLTRFYQLLNAGAFETFLDGTCRFVTTASIRAHLEAQLAKTRGGETPATSPSKRSGGPGRPPKGMKTARIAPP
jgi:hypothetical protein